MSANYRQSFDHVHLYYQILHRYGAAEVGVENVAAVVQSRLHAAADSVDVAGRTLTQLRVYRSAYELTFLSHAHQQVLVPNLFDVILQIIGISSLSADEATIATTFLFV
jgi:hypothetical protein